MLELFSNSDFCFFSFIYFGRQVKSAVKYIRGNLSLHFWTYTQNAVYLSEDEWMKHALNKLHGFEEDILNKMKNDGWDGVESPEKQQWTQMGALFYSIIVITTIGNYFFCGIFYLNFSSFILMFILLI